MGRLGVAGVDARLAGRFGQAEAAVEVLRFEHPLQELTELLAERLGRGSTAAVLVVAVLEAEVAHGIGIYFRIAVRAGWIVAGVTRLVLDGAVVVEL